MFGNLDRAADLNSLSIAELLQSGALSDTIALLFCVSISLDSKARNFWNRSSNLRLPGESNVKQQAWSVMSALLVAAALAAVASGIVTGCIAYILISFRHGGHVLASRTGHGSLALIVVTPAASRRRPLPRAHMHGVRRPLQPSLAH